MVPMLRRSLSPHPSRRDVDVGIKHLEISDTPLFSLANFCRVLLRLDVDHYAMATDLELDIVDDWKRCSQMYLGGCSSSYLRL